MASWSAREALETGGWLGKSAFFFLSSILGGFFFISRLPSPGYSVPVIQSRAVALQESPKLTSFWGLWEEVCLSREPAESAEAR